MKNFSYLLIAFLITLSIAGNSQTLRTIPGTSFQYYEYLPTKAGSPSLSIYFGGFQEKVLESRYAKEYIVNNRDQFIHLMPVLPCTDQKCGWEQPFGGQWSMVYFTRWAKLNYAQYNDGRTYGYGYSAGGDYDPIALLGAEFTAFVVCAGSSNNPTKLEAYAKLQVPIWHFHGTKDTSAPNTYEAGLSAKKYLEKGGAKLRFISIEGGTHESAPALAFSKNYHLGDTLRALGEIHLPVPDPRDTIVTMYIDNKILYHVGKSGKIYKGN